MRAFIGLLAAALAGVAGAAAVFTEADLQARFYFDLGPVEIDVSKYPEAQQKNYAVFAKTCAQCHTLARPINSPMTAREDWKRYIVRMQERSKSRPGKAVAAKDRKAILEFLVYDSKVRKVDGKTGFEELTDRLKARFQEVQEEARRRRLQKDEEKAKTPAPYTGDKP